VVSAKASYLLLHGDVDAPLLVVMGHFKLDVFGWGSDS
jgi:hypothetical protein